jgi:hypothetical protein
MAHSYPNPFSLFTGGLFSSSDDSTYVVRSHSSALLALNHEVYGTRPSVMSRVIHISILAR